MDFPIKERWTRISKALYMAVFKNSVEKIGPSIIRGRSEARNRRSVAVRSRWCDFTLQRVASRPLRPVSLDAKIHTKKIECCSKFERRSKDFLLFLSNNFCSSMFIKFRIIIQNLKIDWWNFIRYCRCFITYQTYRESPN